MENTKRIKLLFCTTEKISSRFIRWAQRCDYSHVEAVFEDDEGQYSIGARWKGVDTYRNYDHMTDITYRYLTVTDEQYQKFYDFMHSKIGAKYDLRAYIGFALFKNTHDENKYICSELVQDALKHAHIDVIIYTPSYYVQPRDFWISPLLDEE